MTMLLALIAAVAGADAPRGWATMVESDWGRIAVERSSVTRRGSVLRFRARAVADRPVEGIKAMLIDAEFDCAAGSETLHGIAFFDARGARVPAPSALTSQFALGDAPEANLLRRRLCGALR